MTNIIEFEIKCGVNMIQCEDFFTCVTDKSDCKSCSRYPLSTISDLYKQNNRKYCTVDGGTDETCVLDEDNGYELRDCLHCTQQKITDKEQCGFWRFINIDETI